MVGEYVSVEQIQKTSAMKMHNSFLMWCMGLVTHPLCFSLGLLDKTSNHAGSFSMRSFIFLCGNVFAGSPHRLQSPAWVPGEHLPDPPVVDPLTRLLQHQGWHCSAVDGSAVDGCKLQLLCEKVPEEAAML